MHKKPRPQAPKKRQTSKSKPLAIIFKIIPLDILYACSLTEQNQKVIELFSAKNYLEYLSWNVVCKVLIIIERIIELLFESASVSIG